MADKTPMEAVREALANLQATQERLRAMTQVRPELYQHLASTAKEIGQQMRQTNESIIAAYEAGDVTLAERLRRHLEQLDKLHSTVMENMLSLLDHSLRP